MVKKEKSNETAIEVNQAEYHKMLEAYGIEAEQYTSDERIRIQIRGWKNLCEYYNHFVGSVSKLANMLNEILISLKSNEIGKNRLKRTSVIVVKRKLLTTMMSS